MYKFFTKLGHSLGKRIFWRHHLREAAFDLQALKSQLPTDTMLLTLPILFRGKGYFRTLGMKQNLVELEAFLKFLSPSSLESILEIGTMKGGTLFLWCQLSSPTAKIVSIDLPQGRFGGGYSPKLELLFHEFKQPEQTLICIRGNSHSTQTHAKFFDVIQGGKLDFLFIDGDHTYDGVKRDFEDYSPYVRTGGVIAFHDIVFNPENSEDFEVWRFWNEIKAKYSTAIEFVDSPNHLRRSIGIGVIRKP